MEREMLRERQDVDRLVRQAQATGTRIWPSGLGQRLKPNDCAGYELFSVAGMDAISAYEAADLVVTAQAGIRLSALNQELGAYGQWLPIATPDGVDDSLGGIVAMGIDGWYRGGYGPLRDRVLAMRVCSPAFGELRLGATVVKNVAGYNLTRLFVGSRGALGVITEVTLKVAPRPSGLSVWRFSVESADVAKARVRELTALASPWAAIVSHALPHSKDISLFAEWHGRRPMLEHLEQQLGAPQTGESMPGLGRRGGLAVRGTLPVGSLPALHAAWPEGFPLAAEWQTGWVWGELEGTGAVQSLAALARAQGGMLAPVEGQPAASDESAVQRLSLGIKETFDPRGILPPITRGV